MAEIEKGERIELIPVRAIKPSPFQLTTIDPEVERMLLEDMRKGVESVDPIRVRPLSAEEIEECKGKYPHALYEVIDGHKRLRNAELLHWEKVRAYVMNVSRDEALAIAYRKNKERGTVDPMLEALYFKHLYVEKKLPAYKIAEMFSLSESYVRLALSRVKIDTEAVRKIVRQTAIGKPLKGKHLDAIALAPPEKQPALVEKIVEEKLSAKEAKIVAEALAKKPEAEKLLELPKPKLVEEAKKLTAPLPPPPPSPEEVAEKAVKEFKPYYPMTMIASVYKRYKGINLRDVLKATVWLLWSKLPEDEKDKIISEAIKLGEKGFEEPIVG